ncbi:hypothetical protein [Kibdelosporangium philippinense]|uniref:hypothetical protein n=1 Tax=Kibdelosporangium philippinense TaxID=211113 RepID=UPI00361C7DB8
MMVSAQVAVPVPRRGFVEVSAATVAIHLRAGALWVALRSAFCTVAIRVVPVVPCWPGFVRQLL